MVAIRGAESDALRSQDANERDDTKHRRSPPVGETEMLDEPLYRALQAPPIGSE
jgi:hypothetical protein